MPEACTDCGVCCLELSLPPFDANEELVRAPEELLDALDAYAKGPRYSGSLPCCWLDLVSGRCRHHELRPAACRWFEPGSAACNELREQAGLPRLSR